MYVVCCSESIIGDNFLLIRDGPKCAAQSTAAISHSPPKHEADPYRVPFSIFMKRTFVHKQQKPKQLGWEYCGEYILVDDDAEEHWMFTLPSRERDRHYIAANIKHSLKTSCGWWHVGVDMRREQIERILENSPNSGDAEKLRSLGFDEHLTNDEFVDRLVNWEGFYGSEILQFVFYDEEMYNFVKVGETTRNKRGVMKKEGEPCALASDWYAKLDQMAAGL